MEPMDLGSPLGYRSKSQSSPPAGSPLSPTVRGDVENDFSDMEVDPNSPPLSAKTSNVSLSTLDKIKSSLDNVLTLNSLDLDKERSQYRRVPILSRECQSAPPYASPVWGGGNRPFTPYQDNSDQSFSQPPRSKTSMDALLPPIKQKQKVGYGLCLGEEDDHDSQFSHYPNLVANPELNGEKFLRSRGIKTNSKSDEKTSSLENEITLKTGSTKLKNIQEQRTLPVSLFMKFIFAMISLSGIGLILMLLTSEQCVHTEFFQRQVLSVDLKSDLFGQHIASKLITKHLNDYFQHLNASRSLQPPHSSKGSPHCKPLVLSFHGWTGVGKNFASQIISQSFTRVSVHPFSIPLLFPHSDHQEVYGEQIGEWIVSNITRCSANLFVFDEMDKSFPSIQKSLLKSIQSLGERRCDASEPLIFLLISNTHAVEINQVFVGKFQDNSVQNRLDIKEEYFHSIFTTTSSQDEWYSQFLSSGNAIDAFVPFLPLERSHVVECIKRDLITKHFSTKDQIISKVLDELSFATGGHLELSTTGCKRVSDKVDFVMYSSNEN